MYIDEQSLGFRISSFDEGTLVDLPIAGGTCPLLVCKIAQCIHEFLQNSPLEIYNLKEHNGVWRLCTIRYSKRSKELSVFLVVCLIGVEGNIWSNECNRLQTILSNFKDDNDDNNMNVVTGCCYVVYNGASVAPTDLPVHTIFGNTEVTEYICGGKFKIAHSAFFQVNNIILH